MVFFFLNQLGGESGGDTTNETYKRMKLFMRASAFLILPVSVTFPSVSHCRCSFGYMSTYTVLIIIIAGSVLLLGDQLTHLNDSNPSLQDPRCKDCPWHSRNKETIIILCVLIYMCIIMHHGMIVSSP